MNFPQNHIEKKTTTATTTIPMRHITHKWCDMKWKKKKAKCFYGFPCDLCTAFDQNRWQIFHAIHTDKKITHTVTYSLNTHLYANSGNFIMHNWLFNVLFPLNPYLFSFAIVFSFTSFDIWSCTRYCCFFCSVRCANLSEPNTKMHRNLQYAYTPTCQLAKRLLQN